MVHVNCESLSLECVGVRWRGRRQKGKVAPKNLKKIQAERHKQKDPRGGEEAKQQKQCDDGQTELQYLVTLFCKTVE